MDFRYIKQSNAQNLGLQIGAARPECDWRAVVQRRAALRPPHLPMWKLTLHGVEKRQGHHEHCADFCCWIRVDDGWWLGIL